MPPQAKVVERWKLLEAVYAKAAAFIAAPAYTEDERDAEIALEQAVAAVTRLNVLAGDSLGVALDDDAKWNESFGQRGVCKDD